MKYHYFYQTKENRSLDGWLSARDRNDAYAQLRKAGIRPYKLVGRNPPAWKRWTAIALLSAALAASVAAYFRGGAKPQADGAADGFVRHQIYGDRDFIEKGMATGWTAAGWAACGLDEGERFLAMYAQPGLPVSLTTPREKAAAAVEASLSRRLEEKEDDLLEFRQMKKIVEAMKAEIRRYVARGGSIPLYIERLEERQHYEARIYLSAVRELDVAKAAKKPDAEVTGIWHAKNAELRAIGLPMLKDPLDD